MHKKNNLPHQQGLYYPELEKDSCGVGFICDIQGKSSYSILEKGLNILERLTHRGAVGADSKTGDGAGILIQMPHEFLVKVTTQDKIKLPDEGLYGSGIIFFPINSMERKKCKEAFLVIAKKNDFRVLGYRQVPIKKSAIGKGAQQTQPQIEQVFIAPLKNIKDNLILERKLFVLRKEIENKIAALKFKETNNFYICSLSSRTLIYKGLFMPHQVGKFYLDLKDKAMKTALVLVHSRYSTNTFPSWNLAQPFRMLAHNGEINTLKGNVNWMKAREGSLSSKIFNNKLKKVFPIITPEGSDSSSLDNVFELLSLSGRSLTHTIAMLIPLAWQQNNQLDKKIKDFYKYHSALMESWDGPAALAFCDGEKIGALLDRNGLRPARYIITKDDLVIMASEMGVLDTESKNIKYSGRLEPGKIFLIDTKKKTIIDDEVIKKELAKAQPYSKWLKDNVLSLNKLPKAKVNKDKID